ncbi:AMP-binding protein [Luteolibacter flavescens]|uniref:AMP-binding protein n=1 Tax=Luteolibacter flavescens TaxID=1859460 RepID=A0ABT3FIM8_9BACT|nr:AMP-binding protein [Luteolibacter flavescens]MCW1883427.1 AMP-binding protein [Luteolibacter flavescens]
MKPRPSNPWWATTSHDEIHQRQDVLLRRLLKDRVVPFTAYYGKLFKELGIEAGDIRGTDDLEKLPFTSKADLANPRDFVIIPDEKVLRHQWSTLKYAITHGPSATKQALEEELRPILLTSTTGRSSAPVPFLYTKHDLANLEECGRRMMELCQSDASWRHINAFPFAPHLAFWLAHHAGTGFNTFMMSTGGGKTLGTEGNLNLITKIDPDAIIAMPTFLYHLLQQATQDGLRWTKLKRIVLGGEKVPLGMRRKLRALCEQMGAEDVAIMSTYGFTEAKLAWTECMPPKGEEVSGLHVYPDQMFLEIVDPETGKRVPDGQPGEIVCTPLDARGTVVVRYRTGDLIEGGITYEPCPHCGRTCPRLIGKISRVSDIRELNVNKLKGTLVDFNALENLLDDTDGLGAWQIELRKRNDDPLETDQVVVHAVPAEGSGSEALREQISQRFGQAVEFAPNDIVFHSWDEMRRMQGVGKELKEKKVVDNRPNPEAP